MSAVPASPDGSWGTQTVSVVAGATEPRSVDWDALRAPFPRELISKLPASARRPALDYVGHATVTDRLNTAAPGWTYRVEPVVVDGKDGLPHVVAVFGSMTIGGISRQEVGAVDSPSSYGQELKEAISDFIRRGAMRFGVALDLWSKEDLSSGSTSAGAGGARDHRGAVATSPAASPSPTAGESAPYESAPLETAGEGSKSSPLSPSSATTSGPPGPDNGGEPEDAGTGKTDPKASTERRDKLWMQLSEFAGTKAKAVNAVNRVCKTSWKSDKAYLIPEEDIELTLRTVLMEAG